MFTYHKLGILFALCAFCFAFIYSEGVGSSCFIPTDCGLWHFVCEGGECKCDKDHIPDRDHKWCAVDILKPCGYHDECYDANAECQDVAIPKYGSCKCKKGYALDTQKKICSVVIGNNCTVTPDCIDGSCTNNKCICNNPLQPDINGTKCLPALHDDCSSFNKECAQENAFCNSESKCACVDNYKEVTRNDQVYCLAMLGIKCKNSVDCADFGADCISTNQPRDNKQIHSLKYSWERPKPQVKKTCICRAGYIQHPNKSECLKIAAKLQDNCTENIQCSLYSGVGSECVANKCECKKGFYFDVDFNGCVRSCLCDDVTKDIDNIKSLMKDLKPLIEQMARDNNVDATSLLKKIQKL